MAAISTSGSAGTAATTVTLTAPHTRVRVYNRGTVDLWLRLDGTAAVAAGDENLVVQSGQNDSFIVPTVSRFDQGSGTSEPTSVSISVIATAACPFTVVGQ